MPLWCGARLKEAQEQCTLTFYSGKEICRLISIYFMKNTLIRTGIYRRVKIMIILKECFISLRFQTPFKNHEKQF
jgi:hypothetical protein